MQKIQLKMKNKSRIPLTIATVVTLALTLFSSCQSNSPKGEKTGDAPETSVSAVSKAEGEVSVMSFNVENLFDTEHDKDREDFTYLPLSAKNTPEVKAFCSGMDNKRYREECETLDWNEQTLKVKLKNVGQVIRFVDNGKGPDNLVLIELENERILKRLVADELKDLGYQTIVLLEGPDTRGIDPGFISKFPMVGKPVLHIIPFKDLSEKDMKSARRTRGILEVTVKTPDKKEITFFAAHFPSQGNPTILRQQATQFAKQLVEETMKKGRLAVFAGDLNVTAAEEEENGLFKKSLAEVSQVSHFIGCNQCLGTHNYKGGWSFLDVIAVSNNLNALKMEIVPDSIQVVRAPTHRRKNGTPIRWDSDEKTGVSDHYPLYLRLRTQKP